MDRFGCHAIKTPTIGLLINSFAEGIDLGRTRIVVDGKAHYSEAHTDLMRIIYRGPGQQIRKKQLKFVIEGDRKYGLVNAADIVAYQLRAIYRKLAEGERGPFDENRVYFEDALLLE